MIPEHGRSTDEILADLEMRGDGDTDWRGGRVFSLVYHAGEQHEDLIHRAHALYASANLLNPMAFKSLKQLEREIVQSAGTLFHCSGAVGTVTSGGTESILCAVAAYRDRARAKKPWARIPGCSSPAFMIGNFSATCGILSSAAKSGRARSRTSARMECSIKKK